VTLPGSTIASLAAMPDRLDAAFRLVPESRRTWTPASWEGIPGERFSPLGQVCHVRDIERLGYHVRIERMLTEDGPARASTLRRLESVTAVQLDRRGTFAEYGPLTLRSLVHYLASHDHQHLACMDWLLGQLHGESGVR